MTARIPGEDIDKFESYEQEKPRHMVICRYLAVFLSGLHQLQF